MGCSQQHDPIASFSCRRSRMNVVRFLLLLLAGSPTKFAKTMTPTCPKNQQRSFCEKIFSCPLSLVVMTRNISFSHQKKGAPWKVLATVSIPSSTRLSLCNLTESTKNHDDSTNEAAGVSCLFTSKNSATNHDDDWDEDRSSSLLVDWSRRSTSQEAEGRNHWRWDRRSFLCGTLVFTQRQ